MANRVTYTNVFSESRNNIKDLIDTRSNVSDPISSSTEFRKFVYSRFPDVKSSEFKGYPFIVIQGSNPTTQSEGASLDMKSKFIEFTVEIEVYSSDRGYGNKDGKGLEYMDAICDDVFQTLNNKTNRKTLQSNGLYFANLSSTSVQVQDIHNERVYYRSFILTLKNRMRISI